MEIRNKNDDVVFKDDGATVKETVETAVKEGVSLEGADLYVAELDGANLRGADLTNADLSGANLRYANLTGADLREASLKGDGLDLWNATLAHADLRRADLSGSYLANADFLGARCDGANLSGVRAPDLAGEIIKGQREEIAVVKEQNALLKEALDNYKQQDVDQGKTHELG